MTLRAILSLSLLPWLTAHGQDLMDRSGPVRLLPSDAAILESREQRMDLQCKVRAIIPELGFDLGFHSGYEVGVRLQDLAGSGSGLTAIFRVIPEGYTDKAIYFSQKWTVPEIPENSKGTVYLKGRFLLGEGNYQVEWLLRDQAERFCSARWRISAEPRGKDRQLDFRPAPGTALPETADRFDSEAPVIRDGNHAFHVLVLLHVASQVSGAAAMRTTETDAVLSILRNIARESRIGSYSITAFNLEKSRILFRRENAPEVDFPALGTAIKQARLGTIDVHTLRQDDSGKQFLGELLAEEMGKNRVDAVIFVGPKTSAEAPERGALKELGEPRCPVFYLVYDGDPSRNPWRDLIGSVVRLWKGFEYTISKPRDLFLAWNEVMSRISSRGPATGVSGGTAALTHLAPK